MASLYRQIENFYKSGYTQEPYIQLVEETTNGYEVVAEWVPDNGWTSSLIAAGFLPYQAR